MGLAQLAQVVESIWGLLEMDRSYCWKPTDSLIEVCQGGHIGRHPQRIHFADEEFDSCSEVPASCLG